MSNVRGLRNNNPGNIKEFKGDKTQWVGERATDDDPVMEEFTMMHFGVRAALKVFETYQRKHHLNTIRKWIERWAPPSENDTEAYIEYVCARTGRGADEEVDCYDRIFMNSFLRAVFRMENGPLADTQVTDNDMMLGLSST